MDLLKFKALSPEHQQAAVEYFTRILLDDVVTGSVRFNDELNQDDLQARIDTAIQTAEDKQTPWFAGEIVMDTCRQELESMALCDAEDAFYTVKGSELRLVTENPIRS